MDDNTRKSNIDDSDLDQMIANIKGQPVVAPTVVNDNGAPISSSDGSTLSNGQDDSVTTVDPIAVSAPSADQQPLAENSNETTVPLQPQPQEMPAPNPSDFTPPAVAPVSNLDSIKREALAELRPLVDKLALPPEEKFNTILLIIRSTDDASLLPVAHEVARTIADENLRAKALLDVIKEIDFFGQQAK